MSMWQASMTEETGIGRVAQTGYEAQPCIAEDAIPFGVAVKRGVGLQGVVVYDGAAGSVLAGIAIDNGRGSRTLGATNQYNVQTPVPVMRKGSVWVRVLEDTGAGDTVKIDHATGHFRPSATVEANATVLPSAVVIRGAVANGLAMLDINLP
jgi:hypothetical protein